MYMGIGISGFVAAGMLAAGNLSLFTMIFFVLIATEFFTPIREAGYGMHLVMMTTQMADRIFSFLDSVEKRPQESAVELPAFDRLRVDKLTFGFDGQFLFKNLSFELSRGQVFAIAGESGRGKTTLAKLLLGKLRASSGHIFFGAKSLEGISQQSLYPQVMYVSSNSTLLNSSILENLQLATDLSQAEIETWLAEKKLLSFIDKLPQGLATPVGENGNQLSPGQRQQLICVRAMLAKRSLYIFDEITSNVDQENESLIYHLLDLLAQEALVIEITHKMKQVGKASEVLFLGKENLALGRPEDLYANNKEYHQLVDTQKELEELTNGK